MSAMANTTPIVTTVTKSATNLGREKTPRDADATPRVNIQDFCEEYYEDILPIIMDKIRRDKRKEVHARLDFGEGSRERRIREGHRRQSAFERLSETYSPSATKSRPDRTSLRDRSRNKSRPHRRDSSNGDCSQSRECSRGVEESYDNSHSSYGTNHGYRYRDRDRSRRMKRGRDSESLLSRVSKSGSSDGGHWKSKSKRHKPTDEDNLMMPWMCEEVDPFTPRICNFKSSRKTRMPNNLKTYDGTWDPEDHVKFFQAAAQVERWAMPSWCHMFNSTLIGAARGWFDELPPESIDSYKELKATFLAYFMQQKKYVKDPVEIHNIKQKDGETTKDFMERFKVETRRMKGAPECEAAAAAAGKKKGHTAWRTQDQSKRHTSEKRSDFRGQPREGRGSSRFTPPYKDAERISRGRGRKVPAATTYGNPSRKKSINKFCDFHNDKGHSTDECMQLKKQIEELVRAGKLSRLIKEIKQGRDQSKKVTQSFEHVREITFPSLATISGTEGPLVIEAEIGRHMIHRMYVDGGSLMKVLYEHCFNWLRTKVKNQMVPATTSLTGFSEESIWPLGQLRLLVTIGDADHSTRAWLNFMIVRSLSPYNGIIGRSEIKEIQAVPSTAHRMLKFSTDGGIVTISSTILIPAECATVITLSKEIPKEADVRHENFKVALHLNFPDQEVVIGGTLFAKGRTKLCSLLKENLDIFAWQPSDMTGVPQSVPEHRLNIREGYSPVRQKKRSQAPKLAKAIQAEIQLAESDEEKTAFHTDQGVYCYTKMPFGLKNAGVTYQRLVDKAFASQIGRNIEVYVDDLVIKSHTEAEMLRDIGETFRSLQKINMKLNPKKCMFGAVERMFLGYMITPKGIKLCPNKTEAVLQLPSLRKIKEVQSLNGKLASLNKFLSNGISLQATKAALVRITPAGSTQTKGGPIVYLSASYEAISAVLMTERGTVQTPVYFVSHALQGPELNYTPMENLVLSLVFAAKRLRASNNEAEYEALIAGLWIATQMGVQNVHESVDSNKAPAVQWTGRKSKPELGGRNQGPPGEGNKNWIEELLHVLWAHRTMIKSNHGDRPFSLTYGTEAVIPAEIGMPTYRTAAVDVIHNDEELQLNLDLLEERRERAAIHEAKAKLKMTKYYNARVRGVTFRPGDFVYRSNDASHIVDRGKLGPKWEGPYEVTKALGDGAY
nr:reverse transcriptase domain-containing protein [Tanacetum cinerariifolium]